MAQQNSQQNIPEIQSLFSQDAQGELVKWREFRWELLDEYGAMEKPLFFHLGHSSNLWCAKMGHESFSSPEVADFLNENFICFKIDKDEFPDLDFYFQEASSLFSLEGGRPLNAFCFSDLSPFFVGPYLPGHGETTFFGLIREIDKSYKQDINALRDNASKVLQALQRGPWSESVVTYEGDFPHPMSIMEATRKFRDQANKGFGKPPKFPLYSFLEWGVEQSLEGLIEGDDKSFLLQTLESILMSPLTDQARGGIHRYTLDEAWKLPNFEKALHDQASLLSLLAKASLLMPSPLVFDTLIQTLGHLRSEMLSENGYFMAAQESESEGIDGLYYCVSDAEFTMAIDDYAKEDEGKLAQEIGEQGLATNQYEAIKAWFGVKKEGTEGGILSQGLNTIGLSQELAKEFMTPQRWSIIRGVKQALLKFRQQMIPPRTNRQGVAAWNFQLVASLVDVFQYCQILPIRNMAFDLAGQVLPHLNANFLTEQGGHGLLRVISHKKAIADGSLKEMANYSYFEDYVTYTHMNLRLYEVSGHQIFLDNFANSLFFILENFFDGQHFYRRPLKSSPHANLPLGPRDFESKSSLGIFIQVLKRSLGLNLPQIEKAQRREIWLKLEDFIAEMKKETLRNPLMSGESLKAFSYSESIYRRLSVPLKFGKEPLFIQTIPLFLSRFVISYHEEDETSWFIYRDEECELKGSGAEEFAKTFRPETSQSSP